MKSLLQHINESDLSIESFLKDNNIAVDDAIKILTKYAKKENIKLEELEDFFDLHGISQLNWGRRNTAVKQFINLFNEDDNLDVLLEVVKNDGIISVDDLNESGNIFDLCKINNKDFIEEAKVISTWVNQTSSASGPGEILLKFILKEAGIKQGCDVFIRPNKTMEVKSCTISEGKNGSGGHPAGQKGFDDSKIRGSWAIYKYLNEHLFNIKGDNENYEADNSFYFQNNAGFEQFIMLVRDYNLENTTDDREFFIKTIVDAICFQYNFISNKPNAKNKLTNIDELYDASIKYYNNILRDDFSFDNMKNLIGCIQLYLYSSIEKFDYLFFFKVDKFGDSENSGDYVLFKDCSTSLLKFENIIEYIYFGTLDNPTSTQGRSGKMFLR